MPRPRKPVPLHVLHGSYRKDRHGLPAEVEQGDCSPPEEISPGAKAVWEQLGPELEAKHILAPRHLLAFEVLCEPAARFRHAAKLVDAGGVVVRGHDGYLVPNPAAKEFSRYANLVRLLSQQFGMTPAAAAGMGQQPVQPPEPGWKDPARLLS
ncbi:MAG TPA: P27 family phage terminase small subunit [Acidimicrobiales bacterium]|nr:P27 family phage terminase small subunit [Acidimicrobiales bacterium]